MQRHPIRITYDGIIERVQAIPNDFVNVWALAR